jgi:hypothetical protein
MLGDSDIYKRTPFGLAYYIFNVINASNGYWQHVKFQVNSEMRVHPYSTITPPATFAKDLLVAQITVQY